MLPDPTRFPRKAPPLALLACLGLAACARNPAADPDAVTRARIQAENAIVIEAVEAKSVVFRNERVIFRDRRPIVCGEFNGRNRRHELAGFVRFFVNGDDVAIEDRRPRFKEDWEQTCSGA